MQEGEPRTGRMPADQDWTAVYPSAASFKPSSVPLPVRMGYPVKGGAPPGKKGNLELMKVSVVVYEKIRNLFVFVFRTSTFEVSEMKKF